ncbi:SAV_2336 N-terminal domain-related protein, partial [Candidatus Albibeggiatoa sp. nov. BB20]|uniref:SAV_2336 N-terminal domain-related protein n=1 Tax=Candidatus Albibeggiatoa sp. nov. BB20 TaxID=3162723 RepID=UPI003365AE82
MLTNFINALHKNGIEPTAEELADALWFAMQMKPYVDATESNPSEIIEQDETQSALPEEIKDPIPPQESSDDNSNSKKDKSDPIDPNQTEISTTYPITLPSSTGSNLGESIRVPATTMLPDVLLLERALRPLIHKTQSGRRDVLDEDATVQFIAEQGIWLPILKNLTEPWFDVVLVVDESASMRVWQKTMNEWYSLLQRHAAFRHIRRFAFRYEQPMKDSQDKQLKVRLYSGSRVCQTKELIDPRGRQVILIASDCASPAWYSGKIAAFFDVWGKTNPVAIVQMLPQRLWTNCGLGETMRTYLHAAAPSLPNTKWVIDDDWIEHQPNGMKMPVITLEPESLQFWARSLMGKADAWISGVVFQTAAEQKAFVEGISSEQKQVARSVTAEQRLQRFYALASPMAQELAEYLAAAPLCLDVMRLVQRVMLPQSRQVHLAEIFLSGLIKRSEQHEYIEYEFHDGVRDLLLESALLPDSVDVLKAVSKYLAQHWGCPLDFQAVLANPNAFEGMPIDEKHHKFAEISGKVLEQLGGEYAISAKRLQITNNKVVLQKIRIAFVKTVKFIKIELSLGETYFISTISINIQRFNLLFGMNLLGINAYVAQSFAKLLGFSLPTEKQWNYAIKTGKIRTLSESKEWVLEETYDNPSKFLLASQTKRLHLFEEQRPEASSDNYVFRVVANEIPFFSSEPVTCKNFFGREDILQSIFHSWRDFPNT